MHASASEFPSAGPTGSEPRDPAASGGEAFVWHDARGRSWTVRFHPQRIEFRTDDTTIILPSDHWQRDLWVSETGNTITVRVETFEHSLSFVLSREQAKPLLRHLRRPPVEPASPVAETPAVSPRRLLWPKVSPLAVWALMLSVLSFWPGLGLVPAAVTAGLILLHRFRVPSSDAWAHSRAL